jgi:hypothetical protein
MAALVCCHIPTSIYSTGLNCESHIVVAGGRVRCRRLASVTELLSNVTECLWV